MYSRISIPRMSVKIQCDIPYDGYKAIKPNMYNLYTPSTNCSPKQPVPFVVHVHGGGWQRGSKDSKWRGGSSAGFTYASLGLPCAVIEYPLIRPSFRATLLRACFHTAVVLCLLYCLGIVGHYIGAYFLFGTFIILCCSMVYNYVTYNPNITYKDQALFIARVILDLRETISRHCPYVDPDRVILSGHSAGAHLVSLVALDPSYLSHVMSDRMQKPSLDWLCGVVAISGVYDFARPLSSFYYHPKNILYRGLYALSVANRDLWKDASPLYHVSSSAPAFCVLSAEYDWGLERDAQRFVSKLREHDVPCMFHIVRRYGHASIANRLHVHDGKVPIRQFLWVIKATKSF